MFLLAVVKTGLYEVLKIYAFHSLFIMFIFLKKDYSKV